MSDSTAEKFVSPVGELAWVFITGKGRKDLNGNDRFVASLKFADDDPLLAELREKIETFWEENKPRGAKTPKSIGIKPELDKEKNPTGFTLVNFWTGIEWPDGNAKVIKTFNAKGAEVSLGSRKIGNGSRGAISGAMDIYDNGPNAKGVTLYLNAIQITKFVPYSDTAGFTAQDDEDGWTGEDLNEEGFPAQDDAGPAKSSGAAPETGEGKVKL